MYYQNTQPMNYNNQYYNYGGYPNNGYPPNMPQMQQQYQNPNNSYYQSQYSPFITPPPFTPDYVYTPGANGPIQGVKRDGTVEYRNVQGGQFSSDGGYNPVNNTITQSTNFNPYYGMPNVPGAGYNNNNRIYNPSNMYGYANNYYSQNMDQINDLLYNMDWYYNINDDIRELVLHEEAKDPSKAYGYNYYDINRQRQEEFDKQRLNIQTVFADISKVVKFYKHEDYDRDVALKRFDPVQQPDQNNYYTMTEEERERNKKLQRVYEVQQLDYQLNMYKVREQNALIQRDKLFTKIKESHDRMLGVNPGESYGLDTLLNNGHQLLREIFIRKARLKLRDGNRKYRSSNFKQSINTFLGSNVLSTSTDNDYIPIEQRLKDIYAKNKSNMLALPGGMFAFGIAPPGMDQEEYKKRLFEDANKLKASKDSVIQGVGA